MYLGPGVAVPNGPTAGQNGLRDRAGSTATAVSSAAGSAKKAGSRRATQDEFGIASNEDSPVRGGKLKKFFGEDEAQMLQQQPLSAQNESLPPVAKKAVDESPWYLGPDYLPEDIVISAEGQVKGATLHALVARLTMHNTFDAPFNNTFLLTYRSFATTDELMNLLFARFRINSPEGLTAEQHSEWVSKKQMPVRLRVFNVLKSWLESYIYEGEDDRHLHTIRRFTDEMAHHGMENPAKQLGKLLDKREGGEGLTVRKLILPESAPPPVLPKTRNIKFLDIDALEMGRQLSLMDHGLYCKIKPAECLGKAWSNADSADRMAAGIKETISTSNQITGWVAESILVQQDLKKRAAWLKHFIAIADACRSLNNFSTMTAIVSGLNSAPVFRLKRTWDALNQRFIVMLEGMNKIMQSSKNFADYREMVHRLNPPCVPFLGVYLTDLTFIEDGNPDRLKSDERLINFGKRQKTAEVIREIMIYQATPYNLSVVPGVQRFIMANLISARNDNELYQQSLKLEPREREDEKISRLLAESGFL
ncbi:ras GEF [Microstroma glucosiphilum]|uniref:Ras GEF n=1 Tax=Pseudomicrostroma glucosiphilum TaxID=1684307 RepID=A0A316UFW9_9BASI|nr:ras GEF [Pseudomicrostroma glucosiphilum]PWN24152.1 ras GEF [Pseudomicrostroma glucosiphilum]